MPEGSRCPWCEPVEPSIYAFWSKRSRDSASSSTANPLCSRSDPTAIGLPEERPGEDLLLPLLESGSGREDAVGGASGTQGHPLWRQDPSVSWQKRGRFVIRLALSSTTVLSQKPLP